MLKVAEVIKDLVTTGKMFWLRVINKHSNSLFRTNLTTLKVGWTVTTIVVTI
jgi:hypothetical protein